MAKTNSFNECSRCFNIMSGSDCEHYASMNYIARMVNRAVAARGRKQRGTNLRNRHEYTYGRLDYGRLRSVFGLIASTNDGNGDRYAGDPINEDVARVIVDACLVF